MQPAGAADVGRRFCGDDVPTVMPSDDGGGAASRGSQSGCDTAGCGSTDGRPVTGAVGDLGAALRGLGGRGGGLRSDELAELERLDRREASRGSSARAREGASAHCADGMVVDSGRASTRVAFRREMLMTKERPDAESDAAWRGLTCEDGDDFVALTQRSWGFFGDGASLLWEVGDPVLLWDVEELDMPFSGGSERFQRFALVIKTEAAGADKAKVKSDRPLVRDPKKNLPIASDQAGATRSKVILKVLTQAGLPVIPEVHVGLPAGDVADPCVVRKPWASGRAHSTRGSRPHTHRDWIEVSGVERH